MKNIFIILGYGIPKDILKDEQYYRYLGLVFNYVYQICLDKKEAKPVIIFSGGKTDIIKPYQRSEAGEMKKLFLRLAKRSTVKKYTKNWQYKLETKSLFTLENISNSYKISQKVKSNKFYYVFVEKTRQNRAQLFVKRIIKKNFKILPLDFDFSANRYRHPEFIKQKEELDYKLQLRAYQDKKFYKKFNELLVKRLEYFRKEGPEKHVQAIYKWWQKELKELENNN